MMADALLRLGRDDVARAYLDWYAPYQFRSGKVPCCVDVRGSDPVPENDSHGELVHLVAEVWRYTGDRRVVEAMWPHVDAAVKYMPRVRRRHVHAQPPAGVSTRPSSSTASAAAPSRPASSCSTAIVGTCASTRS